jgi:hypothetical protein
MAAHAKLKTAGRKRSRKKSIDTGMTDIERSFHEKWLGMVQPSEGLVVSVPALVEAQVMASQGSKAQHALRALVQPDDSAPAAIIDLPAFFEQLLELDPCRFDVGDALPEALALLVPEGNQTLRPTMALRKADASGARTDLLSPAALAGQRYVALVWEAPLGLDLDKPETQTGRWEYPLQRKLERLLRECQVPIGLLCNGHELRLVYAPHGEASGWLAFRMKHMCESGGQPILDALVMLLSRASFFGVAQERQLPSLLALSRDKQGEVTSALAQQVFDALEILLAGFAAAGERDGDALLRNALEREDDHLYAGMLTLLLRLVFVLYCEDRGLFPSDHPIYQKSFSLLALFDQLQDDAARYPDSMARRFGSYARLVSLFRAVYLGVEHGTLRMPPRRGQLFDPHAYPFLEGWGPSGSAPVASHEERAAVRVPTLDDGTVHKVLERLIVLSGQRLSYATLDVEQIGSVYEALMGFTIERLQAPAVRIAVKKKSSAARLWVEARAVLEVAESRRAAHLQDELGFESGVAKAIASALKGVKDEDSALEKLEPLSGKRAERAPAGTLVVQPGPERRRTSSHYTPRKLTEPIVEHTLAPLIAAMGPAPKSSSLLNLVVCDPAMGSGAFLVAACRYLADQLRAAWTRENQIALIADAHDDVVNHARRLVAQRCLYGVDKNPYAVQLARLSLWLVTMARDEPFTFVDHALRHGDSLVGLSFDQIRAFHWQPEKQLETCERVLKEALDEAVAIRQRIQALAGDSAPEAQREKERLLFDAEDATDRVRLLGDVVVGAFFAADSDKARKAERDRRLDVVEKYLSDDEAAGDELRALQAELKKTQVPFHWMVEFPEVFYLERLDPLDGDRPNGHAYVEGFVGNPPFAGKNGITEQGGERYLPWLQALHAGAHGNADLSAHFFRRADSLLGDHGTLGLIATNTIGQGDTRATGLQALVKRGYALYRATRNLPWQAAGGDAAVTVSVVHMARGTPAQRLMPVLDEVACEAINSRLRPKPERPDPIVLRANADCAFVGSYVLGMGFTFADGDPDATPLAEMERLIAEDPRNRERIFPYLGGEEVNTSPTQSHDRYVISFGQMSLEEAEAWPALLRIVREKVKPERDKNNRDVRRIYWWRFGEVAPALYAAIAPLPRSLVAARVTKHLCISFQPTDRVYAETMYAFALPTHTPFSILQSRIHESWARLLSSSLEDRLRYAASDCFETFPFPHPDPRTVLPELESIGERLYEARAKYMVDTNQGLTKTYNALKDAAVSDPRILELRALHEELDRAVLAAYDWAIPVPPFCALTPADVLAREAFDDEVIDRLFLLNEQRAREEERVGAGKAQKPAAKPKKDKRARKPASKDQLGLPGSGEQD